MVSQKYLTARPAIEAWIASFENLSEVTGDDLNDLYIKRLAWKQDSDEAKTKRNLLVWIRKNFPEKDVRGLAMTKLINTSMSNAAMRQVKKETTLAAQSFGCPPKDVSPPVPTINLTTMEQQFLPSTLLPPPIPGLLATTPTSHTSALTPPPQPSKVLSPPSLNNPVFPKDVDGPDPISAGIYTLPSTNESTPAPNPIQDSPQDTTDTSVPPTSNPDFAKPTVTIHVDPQFFHELLLDAHVALNAGAWDTSIAKLSNAIAFVVLTKEKERQVLASRSEETVVVQGQGTAVEANMEACLPIPIRKDGDVVLEGEEGGDTAGHGDGDGAALRHHVRGGSEAGDLFLDDNDEESEWSEEEL
ncbi:Hypothetical predicted protein [Lecanosticta acicola]|uniref:Uncharacterized protein n=1 Tax=Lecanosticta acicola TaxID=111012 RepID=A0AAI9EB13_9PEZI|nr:Hypothetical predicted protein [Lecanosticta acicola]